MGKELITPTAVSRRYVFPAHRSSHSCPLRCLSLRYRSPKASRRQRFECRRALYACDFKHRTSGNSHGGLVVEQQVLAAWALFERCAQNISYEIPMLLSLLDDYLDGRLDEVFGHRQAAQETDSLCSAAAGRVHHLFHLLDRGDRTAHLLICPRRNRNSWPAITLNSRVCASPCFSSRNIRRSSCCLRS
jgi:hypothetical protein